MSGTSGIPLAFNSSLRQASLYIRLWPLNLSIELWCIPYSCHRHKWDFKFCGLFRRGLILLTYWWFLPGGWQWTVIRKKYHRFRLKEGFETKSYLNLETQVWTLCGEHPSNALKTTHNTPGLLCIPHKMPTLAMPDKTLEHPKNARKTTQKSLTIAYKLHWTP